jgi:hypothetical protein
LDGPLQTLGFLFRYEIQNGGYGRTWFNIGPYGENVSKRFGGGHLGFPIGIKNTHLVEDLPMIIPGQFGFNYPSGF